MTTHAGRATGRAAGMLRAAAWDEQVPRGARLHCLYAAELLDPYGETPDETSVDTDAQRCIREALRMLAALPDALFTNPVRTASVHARRALRDLDP